MLHLNSHERYYFYNQITDMRKGCYSLCGIVQNELRKNILLGDVFVFINTLSTNTSFAPARRRAPALLPTVTTLQISNSHKIMQGLLTHLLPWSVSSPNTAFSLLFKNQQGIFLQ